MSCPHYSSLCLSVVFSFCLGLSLTRRSSPALSLSLARALTLARRLIYICALEDTIGIPTCWNGVLQSPSVIVSSHLRLSLSLSFTATQRKATQLTATQSKAKQINSKHITGKQSKAQQRNAKQSKANQSKSKQSNAKQCKSNQRRAKQSRAKQSKRNANQRTATQSKAKQIKAMRSIWALQMRYRM